MRNEKGTWEKGEIEVVKLVINGKEVKAEKEKEGSNHDEEVR